MMIESLIAMARYLSARQDDDLADRMNYLYTPNMLLVFSVLISFKQFGGRPLECMFPNKFPGSWEQYAEMLCWSEDTYYLPPEVHVATVHESQRYSADRRMSYYQWVPFFLLIQAACFRFPSFLWKCLSLSSGIRIHDIVTRSIDSNNVEEENRQRTIDTLARYLARVLHFHHQITKRSLIAHKTPHISNFTYSASFISYMYLFTKLLYLANVIVQIYLMNKFLETDQYHWYGLSVFSDILKGVPWQTSGYFPRVSLCDFTVRQVANIQKYTVQCVLVINIFNEKIFILLWCWYTLLFAVTLGSLLYWTTILLIPRFGQSFVFQALENCENFSQMRVPNERKKVARFVNECLKQDGVLTLRMISLHAGVLFNSELLTRLYEVHCDMDEQLLGTIRIEDIKAHGKKANNPKSLEAGILTGNKMVLPFAKNMAIGNDISKKEKKDKEKKEDKKEKEENKKKPNSVTKNSQNGPISVQSNKAKISKKRALTKLEELAAGGMTTTLLPIATAGNNANGSSSSSSSSESEDDQFDDDDMGGNLSSRSGGRHRKGK